MAQRTYSDPKIRPTKTPPQTNLRNLRTAAGLKLDDVCQVVTETLHLEKPFTRGAMSAIETGLRGASPEVLDAIAAAYGLEPGAIAYEPVENKAAVA